MCRYGAKILAQVPEKKAMFRLVPVPNFLSFRLQVVSLMHIIGFLMGSTPRANKGICWGIQGDGLYTCEIFIVELTISLKGSITTSRCV